MTWVFEREYSTRETLASESFLQWLEDMEIMRKSPRPTMMRWLYTDHG